MRSTCAFLGVAVLLAASASGHYMTKDGKTADKKFLEKQTFIMEIFQHLSQDDIFAHKYDAEREFVIKDNLDSFDKPELVEEFVRLYETAKFGKNELFSVFYERHLKYARGLVNAFYLAKNFEVFRKVVTWSRFHCNKQLFFYALSVASLARDDMQGLILPAVYEIIPNYFFNAETIQRAQKYKMHGFHNVRKDNSVYTVEIQDNYTNYYGPYNDENVLAYFREDIGLNAFYFYHNTDYPYWTKGAGQKLLANDRRGSFYIYLHWQLLARYYMERLSNDLGQIHSYNYYEMALDGYYSGLRYDNGIHFPERENFYRIFNAGNYDRIRTTDNYERRLYDVIDLQRILLPSGEYRKLTEPAEFTEFFGNLLQGNADSLNRKYYGSMDRSLRYLANEGVKYGKYHERIPNVLMHAETSIRDPHFFEIYKYLVNFYWKLADHFEPYSYKELDFDDVSIDSCEMDKLITFMDQSDADISNAIDVEVFDEGRATDFMKFGRVSHHNGEDFLVEARKYRLNHLPFNFKLGLTAKTAQKAVVKVFIAPKYDHLGHKLHFSENYRNFFELEHFLVDLVEGKNVITRNSNDFSWYIKDRTTYFELYQKLMLASNSDDYKFPLDMSEAHCGFPQRLMLPRGKKGGQPFQFFFYVYKFTEPKVKQFTGFDPVISCGIGSGARYVDDTPFGYPLDRPVKYENFKTGNMYFYDTLIYHKSESEVNASH